MLVDVDTSVLARVLNPSKAKLQSKGVASVQQRVLNLRSEYPRVSHDSLCDQLMEAFFNTYGDRAAVETLNIDTVRHNERLMTYYNRLGEWSWRFGNNPDFQHHFETRFDWGTADVHVQVSGSLVTDAAVYSDSLRPAMPKLLALALTNVRYDRSGIDQAIRRTTYLLREYSSADYLVAAPIDALAALEAADRATDGKTVEQCLASLSDDDDRRALVDLRAWLSSSL